MKVTDYIISFLLNKGVTDIFGYPGGVICHLMDSATKFPQIKVHTNYHEQGAAFAACGYAQATGKLGIAYSTSGPGATNLVTGIANAYYDSIPTLFITGQVDTYAEKGDYPVRQRGFQETEVISMVKDMTKYAVRVDNVEDIKYCLERAYYTAFEGNPGPVLLDLPADIQRADVDINLLRNFPVEEDIKTCDYKIAIQNITEVLANSKRPVILAGNGVKTSGTVENLKRIIETLNIPVVFTMPAFDAFASDYPLNFGFIGTNGNRYSNMLLGKCDLLITLGTRLCIRQIGLKRENFIPKTKLIRVDVDAPSFTCKVHEDETSYVADLVGFLPEWERYIASSHKTNNLLKYDEWIDVCNVIKNSLKGYDDQVYNKYIAKFSSVIPDNTDFTLDVGQNQLWFIQSFNLKENQKVYMSAGHGAMGYSLPAAIGVAYGSQKTVVSFNGDGGLMMNVQELQFIKREQLSIKIVCFNNYALGMIRDFQERNFNSNYTQTTSNSGYLTVDMRKLADAFDIPFISVSSEEEIAKLDLTQKGSKFIEVQIPMDTVLVPNFGKTIQDQNPAIERELYDFLMNL